MNDFWGTHWWLIIVLLGLCFPLTGMIMAVWTQHNYFKHRHEALETLKIYANQGKEPPPEVVDALTGWAGRRWRRRWSEAATAGVAGASPSDWVQASSSFYEARAARWRAREPLRRWHNAILMSALTAGLYLASQEIKDAVIADRFLVAAIIIGAIAAGAILSAVLATAIRPK